MSLFVVKRGFRLPHNRTELEQNMLYVERQLEQYLHTHELREGSRPCSVERRTGEVLRDTECSEFGYGDNRPFDPPVWVSPIHNEDWYKFPWWTQNFFNNEVAVSTANPHSGTSHFRFTVPTLSNARVFRAAMLHSDLCFSNFPEQHQGDNFPWSARVNRGDTVTWSYYVMASNSTYRSRIFMQTHAMDGSSGVSVIGPRILLPTSYTRMELTYEAEEPGYVSVGIALDGNTQLNTTTIIDFDSPSLVVTGEDSAGDSLVTRRTGFRFPRRDFDNESAKMENARYLQTQLELYLHDHVEAEEEEGGGINL